MALVVDRSGSMHTMGDAVVTGFNRLVAEQKKIKGVRVWGGVTE